MPKRKPLAKSSKASKAAAAHKPATRKAAARAAPVKGKAAAVKAVARKPTSPPRNSVPKTPSKIATPKVAAIAAKVAPKSAKPVAAAKPATVAKLVAVEKPAPAAKAVPAAKPAATSKPAAAVVTAVAVRTSASASQRPADSYLTGPMSPGMLAGQVGADTEDSEEGHNLLAGPRNVKPYIVKRGEQYMNKEQTEHFRKILLAWKRDLMMEVDRTVSHMKDEAANFPDPNDRATQEEEFSLELRTRDRERKLIRKIEEAIKRIEDGSYGYCLETGEEIGVKRLEARPVATLSLEAQERRERREKQYGDRDDRYR